MTKSDLIRILSQKMVLQHKAELTQTIIENAIFLFFSEISQALKQNQRVELRGFGAFSTRLRGPRQARNPRTGQQLYLKEKRVPFFKASKDLILQK